MKGIILYKSKYGATKKYADWIAEETGFVCSDMTRVKVADVLACDIIVIGGGIYASGVAGLDFLKKHIDALADKKIIVFCDGASPYEENAFNEIRKHNMKDKLERMPFFYCRGGWNMDSMTFMDRSLCKLLRKAVAKKDPSEYEVWETALMAAGDDQCDWTDREYIKPIIEEIYKGR